MTLRDQAKREKRRQTEAMRPGLEREIALVGRWIRARRALVAAGCLEDGERICPQAHTGKGTIYWWRGRAYDASRVERLVIRLEAQAADAAAWKVAVMSPGRKEAA